MTEQQIRFARSGSGTRIAFSTTGTGSSPLVRAAHWLGSLDFDRHTPVWGPCIDALARRNRLTQYDCRGCGMSDRMFTSQFFPAATPAQAHAFNEIQRRATAPATAARLMRAFSEIDASEALGRVRAPTLVFHSRGDQRVPLEEGRFLAASIGGAHFEPLDSDSHVPLPGEPAFLRLHELLQQFLVPEAAGSTAFPSLTPRERQVLELLARGLDNAQIGAHLQMADKTVRNHVPALFDKLGVENRPQAIVRARDAGLGDRHAPMPGPQSQLKVSIAVISEG